MYVTILTKMGISATVDPTPDRFIEKCCIGRSLAGIECVTIAGFDCWLPSPPESTQAMESPTASNRRGTPWPARPRRSETTPSSEVALIAARCSRHHAEA